MGVFRQSLRIDFSFDRFLFGGGRGHDRQLNAGDLRQCGNVVLFAAAASFAGARFPVFTL